MRLPIVPPPPGRDLDTVVQLNLTLNDKQENEITKLYTLVWETKRGYVDYHRM